MLAVSGSHLTGQRRPWARAARQLAGWTKVKTELYSAKWKPHAPSIKQCSEALAVDDPRARLVVLLFGNPHLLEGCQGGQDGAADPHRVPALGGRDDLDLHSGWCESGQLFRHALANAREHCGSAGEDHVGVELSPHVDVARHDGPESRIMDAIGLL